MSELFGCLFKACGRWPDDELYSTFNNSCSDYKTMTDEEGIDLPSPASWNHYNSFESLEDCDKDQFNIEG